jgi:serine/threonine-protein kinase HipA
MSGADRLTLQIYLDGDWQDAAMVEAKSVEKGICSATRSAYDVHYYFANGDAAAADPRPVFDYRAISVCQPLSLDETRLGSWPPFLLDLLPQAHARKRLAATLSPQLDSESRVLDYPLLLRSAGAPIGNIRVKEAWLAEQERIQGLLIKGVTTEDIFAGSESFRDMADRFALLASGSSGAQGEWPKILLTRAPDGLWYPDSVIADDQAQDHIIVKMSRAKYSEDILILEAEAPYLEVAREFGLRVGRPLTYQHGKLLIPRFDRQVTREKVVRFGQESLVAATGVAEFGHATSHEKYIATLYRYCTDPVAEIIEYVLRDVLNRASGDTDNHGRNTALQKRPDGWIGLTPRFDFAPMEILPIMIMPSTTWACWRNQQHASPYHAVCDAIGEVISEALGESSGVQAIVDTLRDTLAAKVEMVASLPEIARRHGVPSQVVERSFRFSGAVAEELKKLRARA